MRRRTRPITWALLTIALLACSPLSASAMSPKKRFAGFAAVKESLGTVPFLADVAEIELAGNPDKIYVEDCRSWALQAMDALAAASARRGYRIGEQAVLTVGALMNPEYECCALGAFKDDHRIKVGGRALTRPLYQVNEAFAAAPAALAAWDSVAGAIWEAEWSAKQPEPVLPPADALADLLGSDVAFVLLGLGTRVPFARQMQAGLVSSLFQAGGSSGPFSYSAGLDVSKPEFSRTIFAVVHLRRGTILWWDEVKADGSSLLSGTDFKSLAGRYVGRLP